MPQDKKSGRRANEYGHRMARLLAKKIGAVPINDKSNEFAMDGRLVTIRCAREGNVQVGILYSMLDRVDSVIAAFEDVKDTYKVFEMSPSLYRIRMRDSKGEGRIGLVTKRSFEKMGKIICSLSI